MPAVLQLLHQRRADTTRLELRADIAAAEVGKTDGVLRVQFPVQQAYHRLVDVFDYLRAARRANGCD